MEEKFSSFQLPFFTCVLLTASDPKNSFNVSRRDPPMTSLVKYGLSSLTCAPCVSGNTKFTEFALNCFYVSFDFVAQEGFLYFKSVGYFSS